MTNVKNPLQEKFAGRRYGIITEIPYFCGGYLFGSTCKARSFVISYHSTKIPEYLVRHGHGKEPRTIYVLSARKEAKNGRLTHGALTPKKSPQRRIADGGGGVSQRESLKVLGICFANVIRFIKFILHLYKF